MSSKTTIMAAQFRLQEWALQIRDCQGRPKEMSVADWCSQNGMTKANYYYRLRRVREACLDGCLEKESFQTIVPVSAEFLYQTEKSPDPDNVSHQGLDISWGGFSVHVTDATSMNLLSAVLGAIRNAQ